MAYEYRLENVDPAQSDALVTRIEDQRTREEKAWKNEEAEEQEGAPAQPVKQ